MKTAEEWTSKWWSTEFSPGAGEDEGQAEFKILCTQIQSDALHYAAEIVDRIIRVNRMQHTYTQASEIRDAILAKANS